MLRRYSLLKGLLMAGLLVVASACSSSDGTTDSAADSTNEASVEDEAATTFASQAVGFAVTGTSSASISDSPPTLRFAVTSIDCEDGGTIEIDTGEDDAGPYTFTYDDCVYIDGDITVTTSGSFSMSINEAGDEITMEFDITASAESGDDSAEYSISGSITISVDGESFTIIYDDFEATYTEDGETYTMTASGTLTIDSDSILNGDMTITVDDVTVTCTFDDFDVSGSTTEDYDDACVVSD